TLITFDFSLSEFDKDPYINGVHDLPIAICINNMALNSIEIYDTTISRDIIKSFKNAATKIPNIKDNKSIIQNIKLTTVAMESAKDPSIAFKDTLITFDFSLSEFDKDPYINGVHDLPPAVKETLRKGGLHKVYNKSDQRTNFKWKSTQDLNALEWIIGDNEEHVYKISISRIKNISKGLSHPLLKASNKLEPRKVTEKVTLCIYGTPTEEYPEGLELPMKLKTQKERDAYVELMIMWRDAASYN
ncbi:glideosome-associated connector, putative, partial [Hepatocystis sp. ex Piliocolobus tephrosceles]